MIDKQQLAALIKAVEEGGDDDDEITEDEAIAILPVASPRPGLSKTRQPAL